MARKVDFKGLGSRSERSWFIWERGSCRLVRFFSMNQNMNWHEPIIKTISKWDISWILHDIAILSSFSHVSITVLSSWMRTKHRTLWGSGPGCASLGLHQNSAKGATVGSHLANEPSSCIWPFFARVFRGKTGLPSYNLDQLRIIKKAWLAIFLSSKKSWKIMVVFFSPNWTQNKIIANSFFSGRASHLSCWVSRSQSFTLRNRCRSRRFATPPWTPMICGDCIW